jgi:DNA-binding transcriptional LysR family regulator
MAHLSRLDFNLFVVFDAICSAGGVTEAARQLNLSQPAISHALSRLRDAFDDPLFVRQGRRLSPTPRARKIIAPIRQALQELKGTLETDEKFVPGTARKRFTIGVRDLIESSLLPNLMLRILPLAPHVDIAAIKANRRGLEAELAAGHVDAAIDVLLPMSSDVGRMRVSTQPLKVIARRGHSKIQSKLSLKGYLAAEHIVVSARRRGQSVEDFELGRRGLERRIRLRSQHYFAAARVVSQTDLLCTMSEQAALVVGKLFRTQILAFPLAAPEFDLFLYWHKNVESDPANSWLRQQVLDSILDVRRD